MLLQLVDSVLHCELFSFLIVRTDHGGARLWCLLQLRVAFKVSEFVLCDVGCDVI